MNSTVPRPDVATCPGRSHRTVAHGRAHLGGDQRRRRLLDDLLVAALQAALALAQVDDVAVGVGSTWISTWRGRSRTARRAACRRRTTSVPPAGRPAIAAGTSSAGVVTTRMPLPPPPADGLTSTGSPTSIAAAASASSSRPAPELPGTTGTPAAARWPWRRSCRPWPRWREPGGRRRRCRAPRSPGEGRVLGQEAVAGVDRLAAGAGRLDEPVDVEVALGAGAGPMRTAMSAARHVGASASASL
jgi:hypothetical protein